MTIVSFVYLTCLSILSLFALHRLYLTVQYLKIRKRSTPSREDFYAGPRGGVTLSHFPMITVQLPVYNEKNVVERLIKAVSEFEYPKDRFEIQVLDDSTDETSELIQKTISDLKNIQIFHIQRKNREGFKAGALAHGLKKANGEFIAIFDADFVPPRDFLTKMLPSFEDPKVGMVQARWGHLNERENLLTRVQAILLNGHFGVEHAVRSSNDLFFNFNGTAGIWRKKAIEASGGWTSDTLTEDLDLSYRAQLSGWKFVYHPEVIAPAELPSVVPAFKTQQSRWAKGASQTATKMIPRIISSRILFRQKMEAFFHLLSNWAYPLLAILAIFYPWASVQYPTQAILWAGSWSCLALFFLVSDEKRELWKRVLELPLLIAVCAGMSITNGIAVVSGFFQGGGEFQRTPKHGNLSKKYVVQSSWLISSLEVVLGFYFVCWSIAAILTHEFHLLFALFLFAFGFLYVGVKSLQLART